MTTTADPGERATLERIARGLRMTTVALPHLAGLAAATRVALDERIPTMGVFASGRLVANPQFVRRLKENELVFVLAHELLHLALRTHDRARGAHHLEFNYAHDYIINDILRHVATGENWYLDRLGLAHEPAWEMADTLGRLLLVRQHLLDVLPHLIADERVVMANGELWSPRKIIRRALWHQREHAAQVGRLRARLREERRRA